jgi:hypothetical protein
MVEMVGHALWGMAGAQSPGGADSQSTLPPSQSVDPASIVAAAAGTSSPISATSRTASPQAPERSGALAAPRRNRTARTATLATSDQLGRP